MKDNLITKHPDADEYKSTRFLKGLSLTEIVRASNSKLPKHSHRNSGFCLILQGSYVESSGRTMLECKPSTVKFHPTGEAHSNFYGNKTVRNFIVEIEPAWLTQMGADGFVGNDPVLFGDKSVSRLMMRLRSEFHLTDSEPALAIEGLVLQLIAETYRSGKKFSVDNSPRWIERAKELFDEQFSENLSLAQIARSVGVHPIYLATSFRRHYRCSVGESLRLRRIEFACQKLSASKDTLVEIALASGFSNQAHFSRIFKQTTGMSPPDTGQPAKYLNFR
jgi:AraC family transcriptional regulator